MHIRLLSIFAVCFLFFSRPIYSQINTNTSIIFFGMIADEPLINLKNKNYSAKGNVALLTSEGFFSGDYLYTTDEGNIITLEGNVLLIQNDKKVVANKVIFDKKRNEILIDNVKIWTLTSKDDKDIELSSKFLGISKEEIEFEKVRQNKISQLKKELLNIRERYVNIKLTNRIIQNENEQSLSLKNRYFSTLKRLLQIELQPNLPFSELPEDLQKKYQSRRSLINEFLSKHPDFTNKFYNTHFNDGFFQLQAKKMYKKSDGIFVFEEAMITPCEATSIVPPIMSLEAKKAFAEKEGYVNLEGINANLLDVPVAYIPWMFYPLKTQRQSGFLIPYVYLSKGFIVAGIPYFWAINDYSDLTLDAAYFRTRGLRTKAEARMQLTPESLLSLQFEFIDDMLHLAKMRKINADRNTNYEETSKRWYLGSQVNVPISAWQSLKLSGETVSDSEYFSDFSADTYQNNFTNMNLGFLNKNTSKRFIKNHIAWEYYGEYIPTSVRIQNAHDIFSEKISITTRRFPKIDVALLPQNIFNSPLTLSSHLEWENNLHKDKHLGTRTKLQTNIFIPFPENNYFNLSTSFSMNYINYILSQSFPKNSINLNNQQKESSAYSLITVSEGNVPLYSIFEIYSQKEESKQAEIRHDFTPFIKLNNQIFQDKNKNYPIENLIFYPRDYIQNIQELTLGAESRWSLAWLDFTSSDSSFTRTWPEPDPQVGVLQRFWKILENQQTNTSQKDEIYQALEDNKLDPLIYQWGEMELSIYQNLVAQYENKSPLLWPNTLWYTRTHAWAMTPLVITAQALYDLRPDQQRQVSNKTPPRWKNLTITAQIDTAPHFPLKSSLEVQYHPFWQSINKIFTSFQITHPRIEFSVNHSMSYSIPDINKPTQQITTRESGATATIPLWPSTYFQISGTQTEETNRDHQVLVEKKASYTHTESLTWNNIQRCLNVRIGREKPKDKKEKEAWWFIALSANVGNRTLGPLQQQIQESQCLSFF